MRSSPSPMRRRPPQRTRRGFGFGAFLLLNALPLSALAVIGILAWQGKIRLREFPPGFGANLAGVGIAVAGLFVFASFSLPAAHGAVSACARKLRQCGRVLRGAEPGSRLLALLTAPFLIPAGAVAWLVRAVLILLTLILIAAALGFMVRFFVPDFADPLVRWAIAQFPGQR